MARHGRGEHRATRHRPLLSRVHLHFANFENFFEKSQFWQFLQIHAKRAFVAVNIRFSCEIPNEKMGKNFPSLKLQMKVLRINMTVVSGKDVTPESTKFNLERILGQDTIQNISPPDPDIQGVHKGEPESPKTKGR